MTRDAADFERLRRWASTVRGTVILPGDMPYDDARRVWNLAIDRRPAAIVRPGTVDDVRRTIELAATHRLPLAIRSGGHSQAGLGVCDGGVVLDLGSLRSIQIDTTRTVARVSSGARVADVLDATHAHGMLTPMGGCPQVGVGGLTLGGGESFVMPRYGAVCDNVLGAEVVTADGRVLRTDADEHPDLFWAIRGGGGNFGVATAFEYRLHAAEDVLAGQFTFPPSAARETMLRYRELMADAPDELGTSGGLTLMPDGPVFFIALCYCGERGGGERLVNRWRSTLRPDSDSTKWSPYSADLVVPAAPSAGTGVFLPTLDDDVVEAFAAAVDEAPATATAVWNDFHGAVTRVPAHAMAFPLRQCGFDLFISAFWEREDERGRACAWVEDLAGAVRPRGAGVYVNNLNEHERDRVAEAYGPNYARLAEIKRRYDPDNLFRANHNVPPA